MLFFPQSQQGFLSIGESLDIASCEILESVFLPHFFMLQGKRWLDLGLRL